MVEFLRYAEQENNVSPDDVDTNGRTVDERQHLFREFSHLSTFAAQQWSSRGCQLGSTWPRGEASRIRQR
jgi:hypothetical protein